MLKMLARLTLVLMIDLSTTACHRLCYMLKYGYCERMINFDYITRDCFSANNMFNVCVKSNMPVTM